MQAALLTPLQRFCPRSYEHMHVIPDCFGSQSISCSAKKHVCGWVLPGLSLVVKSGLKVFNLKSGFSFA